MKQKTVLFFTTIYPQKTGGMEVYNYRLSKKLLSDDYSDIIMLTFDKGIADNKKVYYVNNRLLGITRWGLGVLSIFIYCIFSRHIKIRDWNTIMIPYTSNFEYNAWPILLFSNIFGFRYSIHCHGGGAHQWKTHKLQVKFFKKASHAAGVSPKIVTEYSKRVGFQLELLPPLVNFSNPSESKEELKTKYGLSAFEKIILFVGSLKPLKSPETLLKAFQCLSFPHNIACVLAGDGPLKTQLEMKYKQPQICFMGNVPNEKINEMFLMADIYVIPSWFEGTSVSLLEAMQKGLCCIGTNVQGINDMIINDYNGLLFEKDNDLELLQCLELVLHDEQKAQELSDNAAKYYNKNYSYESHIKAVLSFLNR